MSELFAPVFSIAPTRRRRFLWAAWWSGPPSREPFRKPDAFEGGARTREEARRAAERAAGQPLVEIEGRWARAWGRVLLGQPPFADKGERAGEEGERVGTAGSAGAASRGPPKEAARASVWAILGVAPDATALEIKAAFRKRALATHPDRGGEADAFRAVHRAYEEAMARRARPGRRRKRTPA